MSDVTAPPEVEPRGAPRERRGPMLKPVIRELTAPARESLAKFTDRLPPWWSQALAYLLIALAIPLPLLLDPAGSFLNATDVSLAYAVMALGLNVVVGFAGLLDLGYVAFYAIGSYTAGWFASGYDYKAHIHVLTSHAVSQLPGIHLNFIVLICVAAAICALAGMVIGLPTLRLRGDYIAIVTLAFGEIIDVIAVNGQSIHLGSVTLTAGSEGISAIDAPYFPGIGSFNELNLRPWYWLILAILVLVVFITRRLRTGRLGRAWVALREDEVAAVSMGIPAVRTKLLAYAIGAALGGISGAYLGMYTPVVSSDSFQFGFSVLILSMVIIGGIGSIWGAILGGLLLGYINNLLIPDVFNSLPSDLGIHIQLTQISFGIYGFLLVLVMLSRPQGLLPERRRRMEMRAEVSAEHSQLSEGAG